MGGPDCSAIGVPSGTRGVLISFAPALDIDFQQAHACLREPLRDPGQRVAGLAIETRPQLVFRFLPFWLLQLRGCRMTPLEAEKLVAAELRPLFVTRGFRRKGTAWFRYGRQFLQTMEVRIGREAVIVKLGAMHRRLNSATHPTPGDCHISIGLGSVMPSNIDWHSLRSYRGWMAPGDNRLAGFVRAISEVAMPVLDQWQSEESMRRFLKTTLGSRCDVRPELTACLS